MSTLREANAAPTSGATRSAWLALPRLLIGPRWRWLTLAVLVIAVILARLGFWQLDRREQKQARNALLAARVSLPPIELTGQTLDIDEYEYRRVIVAGEYDAAGEIALRNRSRVGLPGVHVLTPLRIAGSDSAVLVNRGWVPVQQASREAREPFAVGGSIRIEGIVRRPQPHTSSLTPADIQPPGGRLDQWLRPDVVKIGSQVSYPLLPLYVEQLPAENAPALPYPQPFAVATDEGPHLGYAVQWFSFMTTLLVGYAAFVVTRSRQLKDGEPNDPRITTNKT